MLEDSPLLQATQEAQVAPSYVRPQDGGEPVQIGERLQRPRSLHGRRLTQLIRYATTSGIALGISEITLLLVYANGVANATIAALIANLAGTVPSYLMSRYWIWHDAPRTRVGRQIVLYWLTSAVSMAITSLATGTIAKLAPVGHRYHLAVVGVGFPAVQLLLWIAKYVAYERIIFATRRSATP